MAAAIPPGRVRGRRLERGRVDGARQRQVGVYGGDCDGGHCGTIGAGARRRGVRGVELHAGANHLRAHPGVPAAVDRDRAVPVADSGFGEPGGHRGSAHRDARPVHRIGPEAGAWPGSVAGARGRTGAVAGEHLGADAGRARHGAREDPAEPVHRARDSPSRRRALVRAPAPWRAGHLPPESRGQTRRSAVQETDMAASESVLAADAGS